MLDSATRAHIERQLKLLGQLLTEYDELLDVIPDEEPDLVRRTALSSVVQSFYQGIEGLFQTIAKRIDGNSPSSSQWHQELLRQMSKPSDVRPAVVSDDLRQRLTPYLAFRHLSRNTYPFFLNWERMCGLVQDVRPTLASFSGEIESFIRAMDSSTDDGTESS